MLLQGSSQTKIQVGVHAYKGTFFSQKEFPVSLFPTSPGLAGKVRQDMHKVDSVWLTQM